MQSEDRYSRQVLFPGIGDTGQPAIAAARVAVVGCGATGSSMCGLLARAGVGHLRIIDRDYVEASNLQRQTLFDEADAAASVPKAIAAARKIAAYNSAIVVEAQVADLVPANIEKLLADAHLILDGTDNFETRYLINDYAVKFGLAWIYAAAVGSYGVTMNVIPGKTACLACVFPALPQGTTETCDTAGILNSVAGAVASIATTEALKIIVKDEGKTRKTLLAFDLWSNHRSEIPAESPNPGCSVCGEKKFLYLSGAARPQVTMCGRNSVQIHEREREIDFAEIRERLKPHGEVRFNDLVLKFWHNGQEMTLFPDGRAIIKGTTDTAVARTFYSRFVGN